MKILYIDLLSPIGHRKFNLLTISALKKVSQNIYIIASRQAIPLTIHIDHIIPFYYFNINSKNNLYQKFLFRFKEIKKMLWIIKLIKKYKPDLIFLSSFETIIFSCFSRFFKSLVIAFNHNNLDELNNPIKRFFYNNIPNNVVSVVFEKYMYDYLKNMIGYKNKVVVIPHIVNNTLNTANDNNIKDYRLNDLQLIRLFAPSGSNDNDIISFILQNSKMLEDKGIVLIAKYKNKEIETNNLILKTYFTDKEYERYMQLCSAVYVPFTKNFNYRVSNVINEAISNNKPVIAHKNTLLCEYIKKQYNSLIYLISSNIFEEFNHIRKFITTAKNKRFREDRNKFLEDHCEKSFLILLSTFLKSEYNIDLEFNKE